MPGANKWEAKISGQVADPFQSYHGKPMISGSGSGSRYIGRVVIELWESPDTTTSATSPAAVDASHLGLLIDPVGQVNGNDLMQRVASALPLHVEKYHSK
jgi:hypothetical protein